MTALLSLTAGILYVVGYIPYIHSILKGTTKPVLSSWLIFATLDIITIAGMLSKDVLSGQMIGATAGSGIIATLAFVRGTSGWKALDIVCVAGAVIGLLLWIFSGDATLSIFLNISVMFIGCIPTFVSAWKNPLHENKVTWLIQLVSCVLQVIAIPSWTLAGASQPVGFLLMESIMVYLIWVRPLLQKSPVIP